MNETSESENEIKKILKYHNDHLFYDLSNPLENEEIAKAITDKFYIISKKDSPATWVTIDEVTIQGADEKVITFSAKLKWKEGAT